MNAVVFYSNTGQSEAVAKYLAERLRYPAIELENAVGRGYANLVLVFPVHCQNIPRAVKTFLKTAKIRNLTAVATYGKMCHGNVLYEIQKKYCENVVAGAYIPTKHCYVENDEPFAAFDRLEPLIEKVLKPSKTVIPKSYKNPFSDLFPRLRSRLGVKIRRTDACNDCGACASGCTLKAICAGKTNRTCIRCLKCVGLCPRNALKVKLRLPLKFYLRKKRVNEIVIYI